MTYRVIITFDGSVFTASAAPGNASVPMGSYWATAPDLSSALAALQALLPANPDGTPAVIIL